MDGNFHFQRDPSFNNDFLLLEIYCKLIVREKSTVGLKKTSQTFSIPFVHSLFYLFYLYFITSTVFLIFLLLLVLLLLLILHTPPKSRFCRSAKYTSYFFTLPMSLIFCYNKNMYILFI